MTGEELNMLKDQIERMPKSTQIDILKILHDSGSSLNENNYGVHIILSELKEEVLQQIVNHVNYVNAQETYLSNIENETEKYKSAFLKDEKR